MPFPVVVPYRMRSDLTPLRGAPFLDGPDAARMLRAKRDALRVRPERVRGRDPFRSPAEAAADVAATVPRLAELRPDVVRPAAVDAEGAVLDPSGARAWSFPRLDAETLACIGEMPPETRLVDALAASLPEDLVWMRDDSAAGRASMLHVAFPSHWAPNERGGASLAELHGPVADGERLRAASAALMRAIVNKGPFERFVWSLNPTSSLDRHPRALGSAGRPPGPGDAIERSWFRVERQTTLPFPDHGLALFAIRVLVAPLAQVLAVAPGRAATLAASIRSMSEPVRAYKGVADEADAVLATLDRWARREADAP